MRKTLFRFLDDLYKTPSLIFGKRTGLHNTHTVAGLALVVLVMRLKLNGTLDNLFIQRMLNAVFDGDNNRLVILSLTTLPTADFLMFLSLTA